MTVICRCHVLRCSENMFGGAKPVPVNPRNYRNYRRGDIIVSLAGVLVNMFIVCFVPFHRPRRDRAGSLHADYVARSTDAHGWGSTSISFSRVQSVPHSSARWFARLQALPLSGRLQYQRSGSASVPIVICWWRAPEQLARARHLARPSRATRLSLHPAHPSTTSRPFFASNATDRPPARRPATPTVFRLNSRISAARSTCCSR